MLEEGKVKQAKEESKRMKRERDAAVSRADAVEAQLSTVKASKEKAEAAARAAEQQLAQQQTRAERAEVRLKELKESIGLEATRNLPSTSDRKHSIPLLKSVLAAGGIAEARDEQRPLALLHVRGDG